MKLHNIFSVTLAALLLVIAPQDGVGEEIVCESVGREFRECSIPARGRPLRIVRTLSKTDCVEGESWGYSPYGVWVSNGCRAIFSNSSSSYGSDVWHSERSGYYRDDYGWQSNALEREAASVARERERLEAERRRLSSTVPPQSRQERDRCPTGFSPSERKCTATERARGCKDIRMDSGLGCVKR